MVWVSRWCKVDTGDPFLDTDVSDLLYLWQGDVQKFFDCGFGAILCPEVLWSRIENTWDFWIWMDLDRCVPAFSRRAFMDHSLISSMVPVPWLRLVRRDAQLEISLPRLWSLDEGARDLGWKVERPNSWHWDRSRLLSVASWWSFGSSIKLCFLIFLVLLCTSCVCFWLHLCHAGSTLWQNYIHLQTSTLHANVNTQLFNLQT